MAHTVDCTKRCIIIKREVSFEAHSREEPEKKAALCYFEERTSKFLILQDVQGYKDYIKGVKYPRRINVTLREKHNMTTYKKMTAKY